jgi:transcriptional regulator with XRE-family HTH domain
MNTDFRTYISARLKEERGRLQLSQLELAEIGGVKLRTLQDWERGLAPVQTEFLAATRAHGMDVLYVVTGERVVAPVPVNSLDVNQTAMLAAYDSLSERAKTMLRELAGMLVGKA